MHLPLYRVGYAPLFSPSCWWFLGCGNYKLVFLCIQNFQILNSDDHANYLKKQNRNPADYRPDIIHQVRQFICQLPMYYDFPSVSQFSLYSCECLGCLFFYNLAILLVFGRVAYPCQIAVYKLCFIRYSKNCVIFDIQ